MFNFQKAELHSQEVFTKNRIRALNYCDLTMNVSCLHSEKQTIGLNLDCLSVKFSNTVLL